MKYFKIMGLTKQYLRYVQKASFGVVNSRKGDAIIVHNGHQGTTVASPALEDVVLWDLRKGEKIAVLRGSQHEVSSLALSPDKNVLAVGYDDGCIRLWSLATHDCGVTLSGHKSGITCLVYDHTGTRLVSGSKDTDIIVWDVVNESGLCRLKGHKGPITACKLMKRYNILISSSKDTFVKLWDLDTYHCFQTVVGHKSEVWSLELFDQEQRLVTAGTNRELRVFAIKDTESCESSRSTVGEKRKTSNVPEQEEVGPVVCADIGLLKRTSKEKAVQLRADPSQSFLLCLGADSCVEVWRIRGEQEREKLRKKRARKLQKRVKRSGEEGQDGCEEEEVSLSVMDELPVVLAHTFKAKLRSFDVASKPSGEILLLTALQNNSLELYTFLPSSQPSSLSHTLSLTAQGHRSDVRTVCFSSDDSCLLSASSDLVKIWSRETQQCTHTMPSGYALCSTFVPGDRHVLIGTKAGEVQLFDVAAGSQLETVPAHQGAVWSLCMAPDKRGFVTGSADHEVKFWEFELVSDEGGESKKRLSLAHVKTMKMSDDVLGVKYSPDQRLLAVALLDSTVKVFFADSLKFFLSLYGHKLPVLSMDISSDSTLLVTSSADKNIKIWGLDYGDCHKSIFAHDDSIMCIQFVPKTHLVFSGSKDKTIKCWDVDNFENVLTLEGHQAEVWCLAVSNDGDTLVSGSHDFSLRLWERTQEPLILSEQREIEREAQFEAALAEGGEPVIPGESATQEVQMAGKKTVETMKAAERIMEAVEVFRGEKEKRDVYLEECKAIGKQLPLPPPAPILAALGSPEPERYVLDVVKKVHSSELEESLLVMPFSYMADLLRLLSTWLQKGWEVELSFRCLLFLLRVHHQQIVSDHQALLHVVDALRDHSLSQVDALRDLCGFNLAGVQHLQRLLDEAGVRVFGEASEQLKRIRNRKKKRVDIV